MLDLRKRLRGVPKGPKVSIVVTDIEDFSSESDGHLQFVVRGLRLLLPLLLDLFCLLMSLLLIAAAAADDDDAVSAAPFADRHDAAGA